MRCDQKLREPGSDNLEQAALQIWVHVDVGLVQDDRGIGWSASQEPDHLKPHLQAVAHQTHFTNEVRISEFELDWQFRMNLA